MSFFNINYSFLFIFCFCFCDCSNKESSKANDIDSDTKINVADIGVVYLNKSEDLDFNIFNNDGSLWKKIHFDDYFNDSTILPYALKSENSLLVFRCLDSTSDEYKIIVNEETKLVKYLKINHDYFDFEKWPQHILKAFSIDFNNKINPIRLEPKENGEIEKFDETRFYHPIKIQEDWLLIRWEENSKGEGWIKWKDSDGNILVYIYYDA